MSNVSGDVRKFYKLFKRFIHLPFVLCGVNNLSKKISKEKKINIIGFIDPNNKQARLNDIKKISNQKIRKFKPLIVIFAKKENKTSIYHKVKIYEKIGARILFDDGSMYKKSKKIDIQGNKINMKLIKKKILQNDIISFDLFDTLIERLCSRPYDIFDLVISNKNLKLNQNQRKEFRLKREELEKDIYFRNKGVVNIDEIYFKLKNLTNIPKKKIENIKKIEKNTEIKFSQVKEDNLKLFELAKKHKKKIIITTDIHLDKNTIKKILKKNKIKGYSNLYISSEIKKSKADGQIFGYIKNIFKDKKILHVGDNFKSDVNNAKRYGINSIKLNNTKDVVRNSNFSHYLIYDENILDKISIGLIQNHLGRIIEKNNFTNKFQIKNKFDFGYLIFGPLITYYLLWVISKTKKTKNAYILFCAREGYYLKKIFKKTLEKLHYKNIKCSYFYTSRRMASMPSFENSNDILNSFILHRYNGRLKDLFQIRFNVKVRKIHENININTKENKKLLIKYVKYYEKEILNQSKIERSNYLKYLNKIFKKKYNYFLSDMGHFGTIQKSLQKIKNFKTSGLYFSAAPKNKNPFNVPRMFGFYKYKTSFFDKYNHIFESLFTAPHGSCEYFKKNGKIKYFKKFSNQKNIIYKKEVMSGVDKFCEDLTSLLKEIDYNKIHIKQNNPDQIYSMLDNSNIEISKNITKLFYFDNQYVRNEENLITF